MTKRQLDDLERIVARDPGSVAFGDLADAYLELRRPEDALAVCERGLAVRPGSLEGRIAKGRAHMALLQWNAAQAELLQVVKVDRQSRAGYQLLGEVLLRRLDFERARPVLQHAFNLDPGNPHVRLLLNAAKEERPLDPPPSSPKRLTANELADSLIAQEIEAMTTGRDAPTEYELADRTRAAADEAGIETATVIDAFEEDTTGLGDASDGASGPTKWLRNATSLFSSRNSTGEDASTPMPLSEFARRQREARAVESPADGRRDELSSGERTRILRMLRDEGDEQIIVGTGQQYDFDFDDPPGDQVNAPPPSMSEIDWDIDDEPPETHRTRLDEEPELLAEDEVVEELGKYRLYEMLGEGGYGRVFRAVQLGELGGKARNLTVALKRMQRHLAADDQQVERFRNEAFIVERLTHPNIARLLDLTQQEQEWLIAYEFVNGYDVKALLELWREASITIPPQLAVHIVASLCAALDHAYTAILDDGTEAHIIHRDVSPSNALLSLDGAVKLTDFGLAHSRRDANETGNLAGKYRYMSPEMARGERLDNRHDIFSSGLLLFELLEGRPVLGGERQDILRRLRTNRFDIAFTRDVSSELQEIVRKATAPEREDRFPSAGEMEAALRDVEQSERWKRGNHALRAFLAQHREALQVFVQRQRARHVQPALPARLAGAPVETSLSRDVRDRLGNSISNVRAREWIAQGIRAGGEAARASNAGQSRTRRLDGAKNHINGLYTALTNRLRAAFTAEEREKWVARRKELGIDAKPSAERKLDEFLREGRLPSLSFIAGWLGTKQAPKPPELAERLRSALGVLSENREVLGAIGDARNVLAHLVEYEEGDQPLGAAGRYFSRVERDGAKALDISPAALARLEEDVRALMRREK